MRLLVRRLFALSACAGLLAVVVAAIVGMVMEAVPRRGETVHPFERYTTRRGTVTVRIEAFHEAGGWMCMGGAGAWYVFSCLDPEGRDWREVMSFRHDDPVPIPRQQIDSSSDRVCWLYMGWMVAVTGDGGRNWNVTDVIASAQLEENEGFRNYRAIDTVQVASDGSGEAWVRAVDDRRVRLSTSDYGASWAVRD